MKKFVLAALSASVLLTTGCATILTEETHKINIGTSTGQKVDIEVDGQNVTVPAVVSLTKDGENKVIVSKSEDCAAETNLNKEITPEFWVNILSGGAFGSTTDMGSKKMWRYQESVTINCK